MHLTCSDWPGDISSASKHMDDCYDLSVGRAWTNDDGELLELACCNRMSGSVFELSSLYSSLDGKFKRDGERTFNSLMHESFKKIVFFIKT